MFVFQLFLYNKVYKTMEYKFINSINEDKQEAEMLLYGDVGYEIDGTQIANEIRYLEEIGIKKLTQRINSGGGSVINGLSVVAANLNTKIKVHTINDGIAASMAGIILMSGDKVSASDFSLLMIHEPSIGWETIETTKDEKVKRGLMAIRDQLSKIIQNRCGKSKEEVDEIMNKETWYNADDAKANGFIDEVISFAKKPNINNNMSIDEMINQIAAFHKNSNNYKPKINKMENLINHFNLEAEATEDVVLAKIQEVEAQKEEFINKLEIAENLISEKEAIINGLNEKVEVQENEKNELTEKLTEVENVNIEINNQLLAYKEKEVVAFVESCITEGKFKEEAKAELIADAKNDFEGFKKLVANIKVQHANIFNSLTDQNEDPRKDWSHEDWQKNDPQGLAEMKANNPEKERALYEKQYIHNKKQ